MLLVEKIKSNSLFRRVVHFNFALWFIVIAGTGKVPVQVTFLGTMYKENGAWLISLPNSYRTVSSLSTCIGLFTFQLSNEY